MITGNEEDLNEEDAIENEESDNNNESEETSPETNIETISEDEAQRSTGAVDENDTKSQRSVSDANIESQRRDPTSIGDGIEKVEDGNTRNGGRQYKLLSRDRGRYYEHRLSHIMDGSEGTKSYDIHILQASVDKSLKVKMFFSSYIRR